ncbi:MAG: M1 family aminopeptidase [Gemmatimonas sp.]
MKLGAVFAFELRYQLSRVYTRLFLAGFFLFGLCIIRAGSSDIPANSPSITALFTVASGVIWLLLSGMLSGDAAARDYETGMHALVFTSPLSKRDYLAGRFLAVLCINAAILLAMQLGMLLSAHAPGLDAESYGRFRLDGLLTSYGFIALPNVLVATTVQFSAALRTRRVMSAYLASVFLMIVCMLGSSALGTLTGSWDVAKSIDLMGLIGVIGSELETWSPLERRDRLIALEGVYLINRVLWLTIAGVIVGYVYKRFAFAHPAPGTTRSWFSRKRTDSAAADTRAARSAGRSISDSRSVTQVNTKRLAGVFDARTTLRQLTAIAWVSFRSIAKSPAGLTIIAIGCAILALFMPELVKYMGVPLLPRTDRIIGLLNAPLTDFRNPWIVVPLLIIYHAGELVWRERSAGINEIADAAPVREWTLLTGKFLGLALIVTTWMLMFVGAGIAGQLLMGFQDVKPLRYLQAMIGFQLPSYLLFAWLALIVQVVVNHRYLGLIAALVVYGLIALSSFIGVHHHLLVYATTPPWSYTEFRGFGTSFVPWFWFTLYWTSWAILLGVVARLMWSRSRMYDVPSRLAMARARLTPATVRCAISATAMIVATGGYVFYNTNVRNDYLTSKERTLQRVDYEKRYGVFENAPQPTLVAVSVNADLHPSRQSARVHGTYRLVNRTPARIDTVHVATMDVAKTGEITFNRPAVTAVRDDRIGQRMFVLERPLMPGDSIEMTFDLEYAPRGFSNGGYTNTVVPTSVYFKNIDWFPSIGYQSQRRETDAATRKEYGLPPRAAVPGLYDTTASRVRQDAQRIAFSATVSTDPGQTALAPGRLVRSWTEGGRPHFQYQTDVSLGNEFSIFSAAYGIERSSWKNVAIELYYHPNQTAQNARIIAAVKSALEYYTDKYGAYPYSIVRFVARPGSGVGMHADDSTIDFSEGAVAVNPNPRESAVDLVSMVVAHEVSHQWWGSRLAPAYVEGAMLLSESLANYSALRVIEQTFGSDELRRLFSMWRGMYEEPRSRAAKPLLQAADQFTGYRKGPFALYTLSQYIGTAPIDTALRRVLEKYGTGVPPFPTSLDFYTELKAVTPDSARALLHDLYEANTFWDLSTESVAREETTPGNWKVSITVKARKTVVDSMGVTTELPMNELVEIGVNGLSPDPMQPAEPIYLAKHRIRSGVQTIVVNVSELPVRAGIDPRLLLLGRASGVNTRSFVREGGI